MNKLNHHTFSDFGERIVGQSMFAILDKAKELERNGKHLIHFEIGDSHLEMPPEVKKSASLAMKSNHTHYGSSFGEHSLRLAIQKAVKEDFGFKPSLPPDAGQNRYWSTP